MFRISIFFLLALLAASGSVRAADGGVDCAAVFAHLASPAEVQISAAESNALTTRLAGTLSGNLATVLRSEWKAKGTYAEANSYVQGLTESFLTENARREVTTGLDSTSPDFVRTVAARLYDRSRAGKLQPGDLLSVRDAPPPAGAADTTLTYYTKAIVDPTGSKHQVRVRNYVRQVDLSSMRPGEPVEGFTAEGKPVQIVLQQDQGVLKYKVVTKIANSEQHEFLAAEALHAQFGTPPSFFAGPHGKNFKLEIKTRLAESIRGDRYGNLAGQNFVQKLDVSLTPAQVSRLFRNSAESPLDRLKVIKGELLSKPGADAPRIEAVFAVLETGARHDPNFLRLEGATQYSRSAFEISVPDKLDGQPVRLQTTVDKNLSAFGVSDVYNDDGSVRATVDLVRSRKAQLPRDPQEEGHWELKVPKPLVQKSVGVEAAGKSPLVVEVDDDPVSKDLESALKRFSSFRVTNRGKFRHIRDQKPIDDVK